MSRVLNTSLYLPFGKRETTSDAAERALVQNLLCYDEVWFLTDQMSAVTMLAALMGVDALRDGLERGVFRFLHDRQMLAWPLRAGYSGPSPITPIATMPKEHGDGGVSHAKAAHLVASGLDGFRLSDVDRWTIGELAEKYTSDYEWPPKSPDPKAPTFVNQLLKDVRSLKPVVLEVPELPVKLADLNALERKLLHPTKPLLDTTSMGVVHTTIESGWSVLESKAPIAAKQLGMIHLAAASRFLKALETVPDAVLHTEPIVESILRAQSAAFRAASAGEVDIVLGAAAVSLPTLTGSGSVPYAEILESRETRAAAAFREMVRRRETDGTRTLLQEYIAALHKPTASRLDIRSIRFLIGSLLNKLPVVGDAVGAIDAFGIERLLAGREAAFYVDTTLRRIVDKPSTDAIRITVQP